MASSIDSGFMITGIRLWNEPDNLSHRDIQMDPDWRRFSAMIAAAARAAPIAEFARRFPWIDVPFYDPQENPFDKAGIRYEGWVPHFAVREVFAKSLLTESGQRRQDPAGHAPETIRRRHHCDLRAEQLEDICRTLTAEVG